MVPDKNKDSNKAIKAMRLAISVVAIPIRSESLSSVFSATKCRNVQPVVLFV